MGTVTKMGVLHFRISGEFITKHSRRLWAEGSSALALKTLVTGLRGMTEAIALQILTGHKKLTGWNSRIKLESDSATKDDRGLPLPRSLQEVLLKKDQALAKEQSEHFKTASAAADTFTRLEDAVLDDRVKGPVGLFESVADVIGPSPKPLPTTAWNEWTCGWLTPEGLFYGCEYGGHQALCEKLGEDSFHIERRGWMKLQRREWIYVGRMPLRQKQLDALQDWSEATGKPIPKYLLGEY